MLQASRRSYICWRCASQRFSPDAFSRLRPTATETFTRVAQYTNSTSRRQLATVHGSIPTDAASEGSSNKLTLRQRLRKWEEENPSKGRLIMNDSPSDGDLNNSFTRPQNLTMAEIEMGDDTPLFALDELVDLRSDDAALDPGDLIELTAAASRRPVLAICLGHINGHLHFYADNGKWFTALQVNSLFIVNRFATPEELKPLIEGLPTGEMSTEALYDLQDLGEGPTRAAGAELLRKMMAFAQQSEEVYQANAEVLDASRSHICGATQPKYLTLYEIAKSLIKDKCGDDVDKFSPQTLYAVHRSLMQQEVIFRPLRQFGHNRSYLFEISPLSEIGTIEFVETLVRQYMERQGGRSKLKQVLGSPIDNFVRNAQRVIDASRQHRGWSHSGIIGPSSQIAQVNPEWSETDLKIIRFIEIWASYQKFSSQSHMQGLGAIILRAVGRYREAQGYLPVTGWTLLQEIGWIPPWEIPARYSVRFPDVEIKRGGGYVRPSTDDFESYLKRDILSLIRQPLAGSTAYCIDDVTAREIDDAVSLERTSNPREYWIHVHVADPASSIGPNTPVAEYAKLIPEAIYLPGHMESMLPDELIHSRFSLAPGRPCLTFSALVNTDGVVLDEKITANTLDGVRFITYDEAALAIGQAPAEPYAGGQQWGIGAMPEIPPPNRKMTRSEDLTNAEKDDLAILSELGKAVQAGRLEKGATPFFQPRAMARIDFNGVEINQVGNTIATAGDPSISVQYQSRSSTDLVENAMKLANEVAARWCHKRGIPIPFRTQPHGSRNATLIRDYIHTVINPLLASNADIDDDVWKRLRSLIGMDEISTTPKPHLTIGSDMYTKATSPLRRYSDLLVHWQIEAALLEEAKRKRDFGSNRMIQKDDDLSFLPFNQDGLDHMLPMLRLREKQARMLTNTDGTEQWILQAMVRAWWFKEGSLPETFKFTVKHKSRSRIFGDLHWFQRRAILDTAALENMMLIADVRVDDTFEVRLARINIHSRQIFVEPLRLTSRAEKGQGDGELAGHPISEVTGDASVKTV